MAGSALRVGLRAGLRSGIKAGLNEFGDSAWQIDGVSGKPLPSSSAEWASFISANSLPWASPNSIYLLNEPSGNCADSGPANKLLTAAGTPLYQQAVTGWAKTGVEFTDVTNQRLSNTAYTDAATTSLFTIIYYQSVAVPAATKNIFAYGTNNSAAGLTRLSTDRIRYRNSGTILDYGAAFAGPGPICFKHDVTGSLQMTCTDALKLNPAPFVAGAGTRFDLAATTGNSDQCRMFYCVVWSGAAAEHTDAEVKTLLQALGWTVAW